MLIQLKMLMLTLAGVDGSSFFDIVFGILLFDITSIPSTSNYVIISFSSTRHWGLSFPFSSLLTQTLRVAPLLFFSACLASRSGAGDDCWAPLYIVGLVLLAVDLGLGFVVCAPMAIGEMPSGLLLPVCHRLALVGRP